MAICDDSAVESRLVTMGAITTISMYIYHLTLLVAELLAAITCNTLLLGHGRLVEVVRFIEVRDKIDTWSINRFFFLFVFFLTLRALEIYPVNPIKLLKR